MRVRVSAGFPGRTDQAAVARRWLGGWLGDGHPARETAVLLLSETFANACVHSRSALPGGVVEVAVTRLGGLVRIEVTDDGGGPASLVPGHAADDAESGRGLELVSLLAEEWSYRHLPDGRFRVCFGVSF